MREIRNSGFRWAVVSVFFLYLIYVEKLFFFGPIFLVLVGFRLIELFQNRLWR